MHLVRTTFLMPHISYLSRSRFASSLILLVRTSFTYITLLSQGCSSSITNGKPIFYFPFQKSYCRKRHVNSLMQLKDSGLRRHANSFMQLTI
ncbi:unnamed protein product [Darwinula stevensoni]|uniref:Uncharacterized protein n=1 Tax=Darwinula stevensoni TaxID=69355 RepID=A0A7R9AIH7_9CRUS|nr:unnamed protein product [Darwinula stevensoni]CAG0906533.1 unnamed protein product [Darwinula stevensoni]